MSTGNIEGKNQYLRVIGRLYPDNRLHLRPAYLTDNPRNSREDPNSSLIAELLDEEGTLLLRYGLHVRPYFAGGKALPEVAVRGKIPFPTNTRTVRFYHRNIMIYELKVSEGKPRLRLTWDAPKTVEGKHTITWVGEHPQRLALQYFLRYTHTGGETWQRVGWRTDETRQEVDFDQLPGGEQCQVAVVATDGANTVTVETKSFRVPVKPCIPMIFAPEDGTEFAPDEPVLLRGQGSYMEENTAETEALVWTSSQDGELGRGMSLEVPNLSSGFHRITLTAGTDERAGKATISIRIGREAKQ
jgi:hypothetical protein